MKHFLAIIATIFLFTNAFAELRYIEIGSKQNLPMIRIKTIEDFEAIINAYDISLVFLQYDSDSHPNSSFYGLNSSFTKTSEAFIIAGNTYFVFSLEGYKTIADYKNGKSANYKTASDYEKAKSLGIENTEFFYFYDRNSFQNLADANSAYKNGFVFNDNNSRNKESEAYYEAKKLGFSNYADYKEHLDYTANGFKTKDEYLLAKSKGFYRAEEFNKANEAGFSNSDEYKKASNLGLKTKSDFTSYNEITSAIDKIITERKIDKKSAIIYYFIQKLPKGELSLSVLSKSLGELYNENNSELRSALNFYANDTKNQQEYDQKRQNRYQKNQTFNIGSLFSDANLKSFFKDVNISQIGSYNEKAEIFKRK